MFYQDVLKILINTINQKTNLVFSQAVLQKDVLETLMNTETPTRSCNSIVAPYKRLIFSGFYFKTCWKRERERKRGEEKRERECKRERRRKRETKGLEVRIEKANEKGNISVISIKLWIGPFLSIFLYRNYLYIYYLPMMSDVCLENLLHLSSLLADFKCNI